jgi:hypothetical protein
LEAGTLSEIVLFPALFAAIGFLFWVLADHFLQRARLRMNLDFRLKLIERLSSTSDLAAVLNTSQGERLLQAIAGADMSQGLASRLIGTIQAGVVLIIAGVGLAVLAALDSLRSGEAFTAFSVMLIAVGSGFLLSAVIAWRLGAHWGLSAAKRALTGDAGPSARSPTSN